MLKPAIQDGEQRGPTWNSVADSIGAVEVAHHVSIEVMFTRSFSYRKGKFGKWTVVAWSMGQSREARPRGTVWEDWPCNGHRTAPGLLMRLLHEMDYLLTRKAEASQAELPF